ncbi:MAG: right-handed parallel beta-helix repeat-containing protein [Mucilaginibacter sp.]|nr:right-handed parallel beta-helix repeat-containing protein [Mucilaginibacter sp.]
MKLQNRQLRKGIAMSMAVLGATFLIASCAKDAQVSPQTTQTASTSNTLSSAFTSRALATTYTTSGAVSYSGKSNFTISGLSITGGTYCIFLNNCSNVTITNCRLANAAKYEVYMTGNCKNVTMTNCFVTGGVSGVHAENSSTIKINSNQFKNMNGPFPGGNFVQFVNVSGGGCQINNNRCEDIAGVGKPEDGLSVYKSNGLPGDSIQVIGNWIRGGQYYNTSGGGAAIVLGDVGGSYQVARNNIVVNGGFVGMQVQGGSHIKMDHNTIYGGVTPYSNCGLCYGNYSGASSTDVNISYNKVKYFKTNGQESDAWWDPSTASQPTGWSTNILKANITATILPTAIITLN